MNKEDRINKIEYYEEDQEGAEASEEAEDSSNLPIDGSPIYPHIYVGQSGISDMTDYNESEYRGDNYLIWHDIFPDISAGSIYG